MYKDSVEKGLFEAQPSNPMVITGWSANSTSSDPAVGSLTSEYNLRSVGGLYLPPLWKNSSPTNLSQLVGDCIFIRGLKNLSIHPAWVDMFAPRLGSRAIPGIIPSFSDTSIPCVFFDVGSFDLATGKGSKV